MSEEKRDHVDITMTAIQTSHARHLNKMFVLDQNAGWTAPHMTNVAEVAATGVDYISSGAITHSAPNLDIALDIEI